MKSAVFAMIGLAAAGAAVAQAPKGDAAAGQKVYARCLACHAVGPGAANKIGPQLNGVVGRKAAATPGYTYSTALANAKIVWTPAKLDAYLLSPKTLVPGNKMLFMGLPNAKDRADVIAYVAQYNAAGATKK